MTQGTPFYRLLQSLEGARITVTFSGMQQYNGILVKASLDYIHMSDNGLAADHPTYIPFYAIHGVTRTA